MTWIRRKTDGTYNEFNLVPPGEAIGDQDVMFPAVESLAPAFAATLAVDIAAYETFLKPGAMTANMEINLTIDENVTAGAKLHVEISQAALETTNTVTLGTGFAEAIVFTAGISAVEYFSFVFNGTAFVPMGIPVSRYAFANHT